MYKTLPIVALIVAVAAVAMLIPSTSQAFLGPVWTPFEGGCHLGCGGGGFYGGYGYGYGRPFGFGGRHTFRGAGYGYGPYYGVWYGY
jgi:hypothetical protein